LERLLERVVSQGVTLLEKNLMLPIDHENDLGDKALGAIHLWTTHILVVEQLSQDDQETDASQATGDQDRVAQANTLSR
jgi:hypothetical protein